MREFYIDKPVSSRAGNETMLPRFTDSERDSFEVLRKAYNYDGRCETLSVPYSRYGTGFSPAAILDSDQTRALYLPYLMDSLRKLHTYAPLQMTNSVSNFSISRIIEHCQGYIADSFKTTASIYFLVWEGATTESFQNLDAAFIDTGIPRDYRGTEVFMTESTRHHVRIVKHTLSAFADSSIIIITNKISTVMIYRLFQTLGALLPELALEDPEWTELLLSRNFDKYTEKLLKEAAPLQESIQKIAKRKTAEMLSEKIVIAQRTRIDEAVRYAQSSADESLMQYKRYVSELEEAQKNLLYFDTEQGPHLDRACKALVTLLENPALVDVHQPNDNRLRFSLLVKCTGFDEAHTRIVTDRTERTMTQRVLQALLIEQSAFIYLYAGVDLWIDGSGTCDGRAAFRRGSAPMRGLCNPHLSYYNCWGGNAALMTSTLKKGDIYTAVLLAMSCVGSINLLDGASVSHFREDIEKGIRKSDSSCMHPCIEVPGHDKLMTLNEFYKYLQAQDAKLAEASAPILDPVELQHITPAAPSTM